MCLDEINAGYAAAISASELVKGKSFVFGEGNSNQPQLMLIGEAPGALEEESGRPFVGKAGKNLDCFLSIINQSRGEIYITNAVKIRPTKVNSLGKKSNRTPSNVELKIFKPWLFEEIKQVDAKLIVTLGNISLKVLLSREANIGYFHGKMIKTQDKLSVFPLYHPAAIIYNRSLINLYEQDLNNLNALLSADNYL